MLRATLEQVRADMRESVASLAVALAITVPFYTVLVLRDTSRDLSAGLALLVMLLAIGAIQARGALNKLESRHLRTGGERGARSLPEGRFSAHYDATSDTLLVDSTGDNADPIGQVRVVHVSLGGSRAIFHVAPDGERILIARFEKFLKEIVPDHPELLPLAEAADVPTPIMEAITDQVGEDRRRQSTVDALLHHALSKSML